MQLHHFWTGCILMMLPCMLQCSEDLSEDEAEPILVEMEPYDESQQDCPSPKDRTFAIEKRVHWGEPWRAYKSAIPWFHVAPSRIPDAGYGLFSEIFIHKYTWLGEYEGEYVPSEKADEISWYAWIVNRREGLSHYIDGHNVDTSNGLRFVNSARNLSELNVNVYECKGKVFYMTTKDIAPGQELLTYYGDEYSKKLGIIPFDVD